MGLRVGKLTPQQLRTLVYRQLGARRPEVLVGADIGRDAAVLDPGEKLLVATADPITGAGHDVGWLAVHVNCNDLATCGARPLGLLLTVMAPPGTAEGDLAAVMDGAHRAAEAVGVEIIGGHTEVVPVVTQMVVSAAALGLVERGRLVRNDGGRPGDALVMTKWAGLEGTAILATDHAAELEAAFAALDSPPQLGSDGVRPGASAAAERARGLAGRLSVVKEGLLAAANGATAMHDATEGGVLGAAYEMAEACGCGLYVDADRIPVLPETEVVARHFGLDPLRLISSGCLLIACGDGEDMATALRDAGVPATVIGRLTAPAQGRSVASQGKLGILAEPGPDELWKVQGRE